MATGSKTRLYQNAQSASYLPLTLTSLLIWISISIGNNGIANVKVHINLYEEIIGPKFLTSSNVTQAMI